MIFFGFCVDCFGCWWGIIGCIFFFVFGVIFVIVVYGKSEVGMLWMIVIGCGVVGLGVGGEYVVCMMSVVEVVDEIYMYVIYF